MKSKMEEDDDVREGIEGNVVSITIGHFFNVVSWLCQGNLRREGVV